MAVEVIDLPDGRKRVFITAGTTEWPDPGDWNPASNTVECVGVPGLANTAATRTGGGGGSAYAVAHNVDCAFPVQVDLSGGWTRAVQFGGDGNWGNTSAYCSAMNGNNSSGLSGNVGGSAANQMTYPAGFSGGTGGDAQGTAGNAATHIGGGGGGAAGPSGDGSRGGPGAAGPAGGAANGGTIPADGFGAIWGAYGLHGGRTATGPPNGVGGNAGGANTSNGGLIVITYEPSKPPVARKRIRIEAGTTSWPKPRDWNPAANTVECIGKGGRGSASVASPGAPSYGGGGGAYAVTHNVDPTFPVAVEVDGATRFGVTGPLLTDCLCGAEAGEDGVTAPGLGGSNFHPNGFRGGDGSAGYGGSGGGAAGPGGQGGDAAPEMFSLFDDLTPTTSPTGGPYSFGGDFTVNQTVTVYGMRYWAIPGQGAMICEAYRAAPHWDMLARKTVSAPSATGWRDVWFDLPFTITPQQFLLGYRPINTTNPMPYGQVPNATVWGRPGSISANHGVRTDLPGWTAYGDPEPNFYFIDPIYSLQAPPTTYRGYDGIDLGNPQPEGGMTVVANGELGVLFSVSQPGRITAIRFIRIGQMETAASNRVRLWQVGLGDLNGTLLSEVTASISSIDAKGWIQVPIAPKAVDAAHRYIATYTVGERGAWTWGDLTSAKVSGPLTLAAGGGIRNTSQGLTPNAFTFGNDGYWVDVVFDQNDIKGGAAFGMPAAINGADGANGDDGAGGGGAGGIDATRTGAGGEYGGGGGGPYNDSTPGPGNRAGGRGAIVISYEPLKPRLFLRRRKSTVAPPGPVPPFEGVSFFSLSDTPAEDYPFANRTGGFNFRIDRPGKVGAIRFYKSPNETATSHTVRFWRLETSMDDGVLLRSTSKNTTASGWQQIDFDPVSIAPNTFGYIATVDITAISASTSTYFTGPITRGPLSTIGSAGIYATSHGVFPDIYFSRNLWVDVVFAAD